MQAVNLEGLRRDPAKPARRRAPAALMRPYALVYLYRRRLRAHAFQELLAGLGVTVAVALVFAVVVSNASIVSSAEEADHALIGAASLQLRDVGAQGIPETLLARVRATPGVVAAAPVLEQNAVLVGPHGRDTAVVLVGADASLGRLNGLAHSLPGGAAGTRGVWLSTTVAERSGVSAAAVARGTAQRVSLRLRGHAATLPVTNVLDSAAAGALSQSVAALVPLAAAQRLTGLPGRVSRILVRTRPGAEAHVRTELAGVAGGGIAVAPADEEVALLAQALRPNNLATTMFASVAALLGFLFAFNAMLLTAPERRRAIADLRLSGTRRSAVVEMVVFQAACLGVAAALMGLLWGYLLSVGVLHPSIGYLDEAFALGGHTVIGAGPAVAAFVAGVVATCLAAAVPLLDLRRGRAVDAIFFDRADPGNGLDRRAQLRLGIASLTLLALTTLIFLVAPVLTLGASALLALATALTVPIVFALTMRGASTVARRFQRLTSLPVALTSLRATTLRSLALAATGALALFGAVALGGSRNDVIGGLTTTAREYGAAADVWVIGQGDPLGVSSLDVPGLPARLASLPGVARVDAYQGQFLDVGPTRLWLLAWPPSRIPHLLDTQTVAGDPAAATASLASGTSIALSSQIARERSLDVGDTLDVPTPSGVVPFRIAATTTNFGWPPGAIVMSSAAYARLWHTTAPSSLGLTVAPGASKERVLGEVSAAAAAYGGLQVLPSAGLSARFVANTREGLGQIRNIANLLAVAAVLALAAALTSAIWQRRPALAMLRLSGARRGRLRRILALEALLLLIAGCIAGACAGIYGQAVLDAYLRHVSGLPVASVAASWHPLLILGVVVFAVCAIVAIPIWLAARVSPALALADE